MIRNRASGDGDATSSLKRFEDDIDILRLAVTAAAESGGGRVTSLLGECPGAGTTTLAVWLARSLARESRRTVLADGNLVSPRLHELFRISPEPGAVDVAVGRSDANDAVRQTADPSLSVLPCGSRDIETTGASVEQWRARWRELASDRFVLIDAGCADSPGGMTMAAASDGAILVVKCKDTRREEVESIRQRMSVRGIQLYGVILNQRSDFIPEAIYRRL